MMERTNYHTKGGGNNIDWALEVEEGWMPYNVFSSHFTEVERKVIHTCDIGSELLMDKCSLCLEHFGPEGTYTLGHCRHTFHITCIIISSLAQFVCPMYRSPISRRFYKMIGLQHIMLP